MCTAPEALFALLRVWNLILSWDLRCHCAAGSGFCLLRWVPVTLAQQWNVVWELRRNADSNTRAPAPWSWPPTLLVDGLGVLTAVPGTWLLLHMTTGWAYVSSCSCCCNWFKSWASLESMVKIVGEAQIPLSRRMQPPTVKRGVQWKAQIPEKKKECLPLFKFHCLSMIVPLAVF